MRYVSDGPTRDGWIELVKDQGLTYVMTTDPVTGQEFSYWMEAGHFVLKESETDLIGEANAALFQAYLEAGEHVLAFERAWHWDTANPEQRNLSHLDRDCYFHKLGIPEWAAGAIIRTWQLDEPDGSACLALAHEYWPNIYGRYDLGVQLDDNGTIVGVKLFEFNADTPTGVVETVIQWDWFAALHQREGRDQWNSLRKDPVRGNPNQPYEGDGSTDNLVDRWIHELTLYRQSWGSLPSVIHVAHDSDEPEGEDYFTCVIMYEALVEASRLMGTSETSAFGVKLIKLNQITRHEPEGSPTVPDGPLAGTPIGQWFDTDGMRIKMIFKLNAWEHALEEGRFDFGKTAIYDLLSDDPTIWVESPYKLLWSNKGFLAVLWKLFKDDSRFNHFLLETYFEGDPDIPADFMRNCVIKPMLSREGANVTVIRDGVIVEEGPNQGYGAEGRVVQKLAPLPKFHDPELGELHAVIGSWMLGDTGAGLCIRVSQGRITNNLSRFAPHYFETGV
ncbi:MAG TPA: glutathionylspermidine synthase family protein [Candidatus Saccharimonadales bacterium]|nr:glutathionylspermidine synthase family protein [Candidatus Saccharimonadales bacterium]